MKTFTATLLILASATAHGHSSTKSAKSMSYEIFGAKSAKSAKIAKVKSSKALKEPIRRILVEVDEPAR